ncbi:MAG: flotillin-like FloA family protein, partial [Bacteroidales bacterium]|nr:flotillin-like FloA family protein [Bacteroidales bacterium]
MKRYLFYIVIMIFAMVYTSCEDDIGEVYEPTANNDEVVNLEDSLIDDDVNNGEGVSFWDGFLILVITVGLAGLIVWFFIAMVPIKLWFNAKLSKVNISWLLLIKMRWQNIPQAKLINLMVTAYNAGLRTLSLPELMKYYLAKVDLDVVVATMIRAMAANVKDIKFDDMAQLYLRKVDVGAIVHAQINAMNAQIKTSIPELSEFYLAGGNVGDLIKAKNIADNAGDDIKAELDLGRLKKHY